MYKKKNKKKNTTQDMATSTRVLTISTSMHILQREHYINLLTPHSCNNTFPQCTNTPSAITVPDTMHPDRQYVPIVHRCKQYFNWFISTLNYDVTSGTIFCGEYSTQCPMSLWNLTHTPAIYCLTINNKIAFECIQHNITHK